ncbi:MAG: hypothetical protein M1814_000952 [Vezdaea aestivalis]|nr:MAG: hypothetical protein M1814_000952 [Vezdaea aestivalis]
MPLSIWHVVKNKSFETRNSSLEDRNVAERDFFLQGIWRNLPKQDLGVDTLRERLSDILFQLIQKELPNLINDLRNKIQECDETLRKSGKSRATSEEQRRFLSEVAERFQRICIAAVNGSYEDRFFGDIEDLDNHPKRLRTIMQNSNKDFMKRMQSRGHYREIIDADVPPANDQKRETGRPIRVTRKDYIEEVKDILDETRGRELSGMFNPMIVWRLFSKQASPWKAIAKKNLQDVWNDTMEFLRLVLLHITDETVSTSLMRIFIEPSMDKKLRSLQDKLVADHKIQHDRAVTNLKARMITQLRIETEDQFQRSVNRSFTPQDLVEALVGPIEIDMDVHAAQQAIDYMEAYYKVALKTFVDNSAVEGIELTLIVGLEQLLSPTTMYSMEENVVCQIAAEPAKIKSTREQVQKKREALELGLERLKGHTNLAKTGRSIRIRVFPSWTNVD